MTWNTLPTIQSTPPEESPFEELAFLEEQLQMLFLSNTEAPMDMLRAIGAPHVAAWYSDQLGQIQEVLDERGISKYIVGAGVPIRRIGLRAIEGEVS